METFPANLAAETDVALGTTHLLQDSTNLHSKIGLTEELEDILLMTADLAKSTTVIRPADLEVDGVEEV